MVEALEFYADSRNYKSSDVSKDEGAHAREAVECFYAAGGMRPLGKVLRLPAPLRTV